MSAPLANSIPAALAVARASAFPASSARANATTAKKASSA